MSQMGISTVGQALKDARMAFVALLLRGGGENLKNHQPLTEKELRNFYNAAGNYYRIPPKEIVEFRNHGLTEDEIPVLLHIARSAGVLPDEVLARKRAGLSWRGVLAQFYVSPRSFYVPVGMAAPLVRGNVYGFHDRRDRRDWVAEEDLTDSDVVNLVNLKFVAEYYGCRPEEVIALVSTGWSFAAIHAEAGSRRSGRQPVQRTQHAVAFYSRSG